MKTTQPSMRRIVHGAAAIVAVATVLCVASEAWACPNCREALGDSPQARGLASGFYYSILFMMSMPFLILGTLGTVFYRSVRRAQHEQQTASDPGETFEIQS
jgi:hypothetical protein